MERPREINSIKDIFYWYVSDYYDTEIPRLIKSQFEVENLAYNIVTKRGFKQSVIPL